MVPAPPWMRTRSPLRTFAWERNPCQAVSEPIGVEAASVWESENGFAAILAVSPCRTRRSLRLQTNYSFRTRGLLAGSQIFRFPVPQQSLRTRVPGSRSFAVNHPDSGSLCTKPSQWGLRQPLISEFAARNLPARARGVWSSANAGSQKALRIPSLSFRSPISP